MIRAVVFDADGVLLRPWRFRTLLAHQYGISPEITAEFFRGPFRHCCLGKLDVRTALPPYLNAWGWPGSLESFLDTWFRADGLVNAGVIEALRRGHRHGLPCFVASTQERVRARHLAEVLGFARVFEGLFFSCDMGVMKPALDFFQ